jgi:DNA-directed RNA polymerase sigma subunit (sigma70/sigma32)
MKISLKVGNQDAASIKQEELRLLDRDIVACSRGDWEAKNRLFKTFMPLFLSLARKRSQENARINQYVEAGKTGLLSACKKYKPSMGADRFQIFALDFIEKGMTVIDHPRGFFARLFGR